jgi:signal transduction histidine kinase
LVEKTRQITKGDPEGQQALKNPVTAEVSELSESLASMARTLKRRNEYILDFARHVSHEFKTPLTSIQGSIELLQDNLDEMPDEQKKRFLSNMAQDTKRLRKLVTRLLELARADMKEPGPEHTNLLDILKTQAMRYQSKGLMVQIIGPLEGLTVSMSSESLEAVLGNLFENSLQAGATQVDITILREDGYVALNLQDNGPGVSTGDQQNIFTPFFTTRRNEGGSGLGLSITQSLLEKQDGSICLVSCPIGACFSVQLPIS